MTTALKNMWMKSIKEQTYYEILEVSVTATAKEIQRAYEHAKETFHADSMAVYSLFSEKEVKEIEEAVEEAYRVLVDESSRKSYDQKHSRTIREQPVEKPSEAQVTSREKRAPLSFTDLSFHAEVEHYRGRELKELRERMGLELETVSKETKINLKILESLEEETFEKLPALVYLKGFLKSYAQALGLDPQKVVEGYLQSIGESKKK
ncbi:MAG: helix-turn-helix domain-containing protein [Thermodesulfobacteriota bacterium]